MQVHIETENRPNFPCIFAPECEKIYLYEVSLKKHLEKRHKITEKDLIRNLQDGTLRIK